MINKHLDGLEMFLGVFEACSNSSNLQMTGDHIYIGLQEHRVVGHFSARAPDRPVVGHRCIRSLTALHYPLASDS